MLRVQMSDHGNFRRCVMPVCPLSHLPHLPHLHLVYWAVNLPESFPRLHLVYWVYSSPRPTPVCFSTMPPRELARALQKWFMRSSGIRQSYHGTNANLPPVHP